MFLDVGVVAKEALCVVQSGGVWRILTRWTSGYEDVELRSKHIHVGFMSHRKV